MLRYAVLDGCVVPRPLYPILKKLQKETGCSLNSVYRGSDAAPLLHKLGKHTQAELYNGYVRGLPGYYPANPPTMGTHILIGDGTVGKVGQKLPWWRCGIDVNDSDVARLIIAARRHGWTLYRPYSSSSEFHHLNFKKKPTRWRAFFKHVFGRKPVKKAHPVHTGGIEAVGPARVVSTETVIKPKKPTKKIRDTLGDAIDVSEFQGSVNWKKVATKVKVAFVKATEGRTFTDRYFDAKRLKAMQAAGLRVGVYAFGRPDNNAPSMEVKHFVSTVEKAGGKFISFEDWRAGKPGVVGVLDFEHEPFNVQWAIAWGKAFEKQTGVKALLYGYGSSLNPIKGAYKNFAGIWFAAYTKDYRPYFDGDKSLVQFWQDRDDWSCPGVSGKCDHSRYLK